MKHSLFPSFHPSIIPPFNKHSLEAYLCGCIKRELLYHFIDLSINTFNIVLLHHFHPVSLFTVFIYEYKFLFGIFLCFALPVQSHMSLNSFKSIWPPPFSTGVYQNEEPAPEGQRDKEISLSHFISSLFIGVG